MIPLHELDLTRFKDKELEIYNELERIYRFPTPSGLFTLLHHEGPVIEDSENVYERILYIVRAKPVDQVLTRLKNIHPVSRDQVRFYNLWKMDYFNTQLELDRLNGRRTPMYYKYGYDCPENPEIRLRADPEWRKLEAAWLRSIVPFTTWDGETIFPLEPVKLIKNRVEYIRIDTRTGLPKP